MGDTGRKIFLKNDIYIYGVECMFGLKWALSLKRLEIPVADDLHLSRFYHKLQETTPPCP